MTYDIRLGDSLELLKELPDESIDAVITDPPYGLNYLSTWTDKHHKLVNDEDERIDKLYAEFLPEVRRLLKPKGVLCSFSGGGGFRPTTVYATLELIKHLDLIQTLVWSKGKNDGSFVGLGWKYRPSYEMILVAAKDKDNYNFYPQYSSNVFVCPPHIPIAENGDHPTQKPLRVMRWLIKNHTQKGDTVLDPFMGSGTTGIASLQMGRNFIGYEIDADYFHTAKQRIESEINQVRFEEVIE